MINDILHHSYTLTCIKVQGEMSNGKTHDIDKEMNG